MVFDNNRRAPTKDGPAMIPASGTLLAANNEANDAALTAAVNNILSRVPPATKADIATGDFNNCLDFVHEGVRQLNVARYLSQADYQKFEDIYRQRSADVKQKTNAETMRACKRATGSKGCPPAAPASASNSKKGASPAKAAPPPKKGKN